MTDLALTGDSAFRARNAMWLPEEYRRMWHRDLARMVRVHPELVPGHLKAKVARACKLPGKAKPPKEQPEEPETGDWTCAAIIKIVSRQARVTGSDIRGQSMVSGGYRTSWKPSGRKPDIIRARSAAMWLCRQFTDIGRISLPAIGRHFGDRDHTTVLHAVRKIDALIAAHGLDGGDSPAEWARQILEAGR